MKLRNIASGLILTLMLLCIPISTHDVLATPVSDGFEKVVENDTLALYYQSEQPAVAVEDKRNGFIWVSSVSDDYYDMTGVNATWQTNMKSLFNISYTDITQDTDAVTLAGSAGLKAEVDVKVAEDGLNITYNLVDLNIDIMLKIRLEDDSVTVTVPSDGIQERGKYGVTNLELLPFFGAANDYEDGYIFYPDGSGALTRFKTERPGGLDRYRWYIYGQDDVNLEQYAIDEENNLKQAMLPVFGIKRGENAFVAIVSQGEQDTAINLTPSGYVVNLARISSEFTYRRFYRATRPNASLVNRIENDMLVQDHTVKYVFLADDKADYSGMANAYRQYLLDTGGIKKIIPDGSKIPLALDFLMGIKEDRLLFDKFIAMTTFDQAQNIIEQFRNNGVTDMQVNLFGWTKGGYGAYPLHLPPERAIGGESGLERLAQYTSQKGITLLLQDNYVDILAENGGFSMRNDTVYQKNGLVVTDLLNKKFLFNPVAAWNMFIDRILPSMDRYPINGLNYEQFGRRIYFDYNDKNPSARSDTAEIWNKFINESSEQFGASAVHGGNAYVLKYAERLFDIPMQDSGYFITDETVPFYQMVVHGLIPYSSEEAGNLFYDPERQKLQWVEYGCMPYYQLTYAGADLLKYTTYNQLFTSYYEDWINPAAGTYEEFNTRLGGTWSQFIVEHEKLHEELYKVIYQDGTKTYINYGDRLLEAEGHKIKPLSYLVVDKEGRER